eukprot:31419-Pelagococcus_subviridis.AAC.4
MSTSRASASSRFSSSFVLAHAGSPRRADAATNPRRASDPKPPGMPSPIVSPPPVAMPASAATRHGLDAAMIDEYALARVAEEEEAPPPERAIGARASLRRRIACGETRAALRVLARSR